MNRRARWAMAAVIVLYGGIIIVAGLGFVLRGGTIGATFSHDRVVGLLPGSPADRAGIRLGDLADMSRADLTARMFVAGDTLMAEGRELTIPIVRSGAPVQRTIVAMPTPALGRGELIAHVLVALAYMLLAVWVVIGTGGLSRFGLAGFAVSGMQSPLLDVFGPLTLPLYTLIAVVSSTGPLALLWFALCTPGERLTGARRIGLLLGALAAVPLILAAIFESAVSVLVPERVFAVDERYVTYAPFAFALASFAVLVARYVRRPETRVRIAWLLPATLVLVGSAFPQPAYAPSFAVGTLLNVLPLVAIACLVYAIVKSHLFDLRFVVSRAVVYGSLTSLVIALVGLLDWAIGGVLASRKLALPIEALAAIGVGFWLNALHGQVENAVESLLFRTRRRAEQRIARAARGLERAEDEALIPVALITEAAEALDLASAALFVRLPDGTFDRELSTGWSERHAATLRAHDPFVLHLQGADDPFRMEAASPLLDAPRGGPAQPRLAVPVRPRGTLRAFAVYGLHVGGADVDPAEEQLLARLAEAAAHTYDTAEAAKLRQDVVELRAALRAAGRTALG